MTICFSVYAEDLDKDREQDATKEFPKLREHGLPSFVKSCWVNDGRCSISLYRTEQRTCAEDYSGSQHIALIASEIKQIIDNHGPIQGAIEKGGVTGVKPEEFKRYGSARKLYNFNIDNADAY